MDIGVLCWHSVGCGDHTYGCCDGGGEVDENGADGCCRGDGCYCGVVCSSVR